MPDRLKIAAVALLTEEELSALGKHFRRAFPVDELSNGYEGLLRAIALADDAYHAHLHDSFTSAKLKSSGGANTS